MKTAKGSNIKFLAALAALPPKTANTAKSANQDRQSQNSLFKQQLHTLKREWREKSAKTATGSNTRARGGLSIESMAAAYRHGRCKR